MGQSGIKSMTKNLVYQYKLRSIEIDLRPVNSLGSYSTSIDNRFFYNFNVKNLLDFINFYSNNVGEKGAEYLSQGLTCQNNLNYLKLDMKQLVKLIKQYSIFKESLQQFKSSNKIGDVGFQQIYEALATFNKLHHLILDFNQNKINEEAVEDLSQSLTKLTNLNFLDINLQFNEIYQYNDSVLKQSLNNCNISITV
ncbi:hypothetical protein ABPG72_002553 [Tetrahymena utriculariae]